MTRKTFEAARDCTSKTKNITPTDEKIKEMFSFLSMVYRLGEICHWEGPLGLKVEARTLPENTAYEKAFKESVYMWINGASIDEASDHAADRYFEADPKGYDSAIYFAAIFSIGNILSGEMPFAYIDKALQYLLPDEWRWFEEDKKENNKNIMAFLGDPAEEARHRFDDIKICNLITLNDQTSAAIGKRIADRLTDYKDGALQLILRQLTYPDLEKVLYVLPEETEDRIVSNLDSYCIPIIKGNCVLNKDSVSSIEIRVALKKLEKAIDSYNGDRNLEAEYD